VVLNVADVECVALNPDGSLLATVAAGDHTVVLWDLTQRKQAYDLQGSRFGSQLAFSPDGRRMVTASFLDKTLKLWDVATGQEVLTLAGVLPSTQTRFLNDGHRLAAFGGGQIQVWDANPVEAP
jgi:WD40 repeat protein